MNSLNPIYTEKTECQDCYKCLRECSVKAIRVEQGRAAVVQELCVLCGHCVQVCPVGAKHVRADRARVKRLLADSRPVYASLAPSFASEFPAIPAETLIQALLDLGFTGVSETARGADLVARRVARDMAGAGAESRIFISSACPTVVEHIKKYRPAFAPFITGLYSPLLAHASELKSLYGEDSAIVFIGPCISKKRESDLHPSLVDVAIDFRDLAAWFEEEGISLVTRNKTDGKAEADGAQPAPRFLPERAGSGALYPFDGGMIRAIRDWGLGDDARCLSFSGLEEIDRALAGLDPQKLDGPLFLELLACPGGCVNGPRSARRDGSIVKRLAVEQYAASAATEQHAATAVAAKGAEKTVSLDDFRDIPALPVREVDERRVREALAETGKYSREDEINCGGCGYDSCRDFARAMIEGRAERDMCVSYMRKLAQKKANSLIQAIPSGVVIVDRHLEVVECNFNFAKLCGEEALQLWDARPGLEGADLAKLADFNRYFRDVLNGATTIDRDIRSDKRILHATIFPIEKGSYAGGVFQDITSPWVRKDRVVSQARKVITRNLAVVQKIAFLLGENAAETEATLTSIIESFEGEDVGTEAGETARRGKR